MGFGIQRKHGPPVEFPLPTLFILLGLKFDMGLGYRDFTAYLNFNPYTLDRALHFSLLHKAMKKLDTQLLHHMNELLGQKRPPPKNIAVDSTGFSHSAGGEWMSMRVKKTWKRRFTARINVVDTDTFLIHRSRITALVSRYPCYHGRNP